MDPQGYVYLYDVERRVVKIEISSGDGVAAYGCHDGGAGVGVWRSQ